MSPSSEPADLQAYRLMRAGDFRAALPFAQKAVDGKRSCIPAHGMLASILLHLGQIAEAEDLICRAETLETGVADAYDALAYVSIALRAHERANRLYRRATELAPQTPRFWYNLACSERSLGRLEEAEAACDRAIERDPAQYPSYLLRSELRVQTADANHVKALQSLLARPDLDYQGRLFVGFALGKELDDLQRFDEAFRAFSEAARARRARLQYDVADDERKLHRIAQVYIASRVGVGASPAPCRRTQIDSSRYIFIVGLPRTGTTLVERILTGLPGVATNGETENFSRSLFAATPPGPADIFERAVSADPDAVAAGYARRADGPASGGKIIEKLPMNYLYLGAIHQALPEAKIVLLRRSALDSCFAMYRTLFREAYPFTYDFKELARYYAAYERLVTHWRALSGAQLYEVGYEDLVREPGRMGADIARHCDLRWSNTAIDIQNNAAVSLTASASQIRRPIYGTSSGRWRHYRSHLTELIDALRRCGVALPADT